MRRRTFFCLAVPLLLCSPFLLAQTSVGDSGGAQRVIDGKLTPELIPDAIAYRIVLLSFSVPGSASQLEIGRQEARLIALGLTPTEAQGAKEVLRNFRPRLSEWQTRQRTEKSRGSLAFKNMLVQETRSQLATVLSLRSIAALDRYVQTQKQFMATTEVEHVRYIHGALMTQLRRYAIREASTNPLLDGVTRTT